MKRASVVGVLVALIIGVGTCVSFATMSFRVYGGYSTLDPSTYNNYLQGQVDDWVAWGGGSGTVDKLSSAIPLGVDFRYGTNPGLVFSLGFTRFGGKAGYEWESMFGLFSLEREDTISVVGGLGSVLYALGDSNYSVYFGGGAGYYRANLKKTLPSDVWDLEAAYTLEKNQLGFHVQGGYQYFLSQNMALGVEILYRMLTVSDMTFKSHDNPWWEGKTWDQKLNLSGINILFGLNIYT